MGLWDKLRGKAETAGEDEAWRTTERDMMGLRDFQEGRYSCFEGETTLWGEPYIQVSVEVPKTDMKEGMARHLDAVNEKLAWIDTHKDAVFRALLKEALPYAQDEDLGPVSKDDFLESLGLMDVTLQAEYGYRGEIHLQCEPEYFGDHGLSVMVTPRS
ncbi:MAG: DUF2262 domain-containing protein, partial [Coriobacteriaceae bacterium]|nr:DUF2262 domain-containing protein [Coriobacteriaceae bacterium]